MKNSIPIFCLFLSLSFALGQEEGEFGVNDRVMVQSRISNGHILQWNQYPWLVKIKTIQENRNINNESIFNYYNENNHKEHIVGGSIITPKHVLTSYTDGMENPKSVLIEVRQYDIVNAGTWELFHVERVIPHPQNISYRLAILQTFAQIYRKDEFQNPPRICFPSTENRLNGKFLKAAGWGDTESGVPSTRLIDTELEVVSKSYCTASWPNVAKDGKYICTTSKVETQDLMPGDEGSPLFLENSSGKEVQVGIVVKIGSEKPSLSVDLIAFKSWINEMVSTINYGICQRRIW